MIPLHVHSLDRLARNLYDLQLLIKNLLEKNVLVQFHKENLLFGGAADNPMSTLLLQVLDAFAQFERSLIKERQLEGIAKAKKQGKQFGRPKKVTDALKKQILNLAGQGVAKSVIAEQQSVGRSTVYAVCKQEEV